MSRQLAVIGLGRLGLAMVQRLDSLGHEVLGVDLDEDRVQWVSDLVPGANLVTADACDEVVLRDLNLAHFDVAAVVIGENIEASILATVNLKEIGTPKVIARALSQVHARTLRKVGADRVIQPEKEMGEQLALSMVSPSILEYVELGEDEALVEALVPDEWVGKSLAELALSRRRGLTIVALKPQGKAGTIPNGDTVLRKGDVMVIGGPKANLDRLDLFRG